MDDKRLLMPVLSRNNIKKSFLSLEFQCDGIKTFFYARNLCAIGKKHFFMHGISARWHKNIFLCLETLCDRQKTFF